MATHRMIGQCPYFVDSQHFLHWREFFPFHHFRRYKHIFYNGLFYCSFKNMDCFFTFKLLNFKLKYVVLETEINPQMFPHSLQDPYSQYITFDFISRPFCPLPTSYLSVPYFSRKWKWFAISHRCHTIPSPVCLPQLCPLPGMAPAAQFALLPPAHAFTSFSRLIDSLSCAPCACLYHCANSLLA